MSTVILFLFIFPTIIKCQILDICKSGDCYWSDPDSNIIPVCTKTATSCTVHVKYGHSGGKVYSAAPITHIQCDNTDGCRDGEYHCGNALPPNADTYNLTTSDMDGLVTDCTSGYANICKNSRLYCTGNIQQCRTASSCGESLDNAIFYCMGITNPSGVCKWDCCCCLACDSSLLQCTNTMATCSTSGPTSDRVTIATSEPTVSPTYIPTILPTTAIPTSNPTWLPSNNPSGYPTSNPTRFPTINPSTIPTLIPTCKPTFSFSPVMSTTEFQKEAEYVTTAVSNHNCDGDCDDKLEEKVYLGMSDDLFFIVIGFIVLFFCILLILVIFCVYKRGQKMKHQIVILQTTQNEITSIEPGAKDNGETDTIDYDDINTTIQIDNDQDGDHEDIDDMYNKPTHDTDDNLYDTVQPTNQYKTDHGDSYITSRHNM